MFFSKNGSNGFDEADSKRPRMEIKTSSRQISSEKFSSVDSSSTGNNGIGRKSRSKSLDQTIYEEEEESSSLVLSSNK
jgi:hypothetical protein